MLAFAESLARRATWLPAADQRDEYLSVVPKVLILAPSAACTSALLLRGWEPKTHGCWPCADHVVACKWNISRMWSKLSQA